MWLVSVKSLRQPKEKFTMRTPHPLDYKKDKNVMVPPLQQEPHDFFISRGP